ncbi:sensor histidine kinase [Nocardia flavorosea]|uniref:histidine kinase n=1 Tax=Nocardia flavorosea TaxID=53429 RepID=A0A846Y9T8_9NOCA|nr:nitrate- and nitrite sensing domain-containing protein [Nocardia flavorosea]NKY54592.1 HAMP domain-containing protein [Nocardia flavorosea]
MSSRGAGEADAGKPRARFLSRFAGRSTASIRTVLLAIVMVPSVALSLVGISVVALLGSEARTAGNWSEYRSTVTDQLVRYLTAVQDERTTSLATLGGDGRAAATLPADRAATDAALTEIKQITSSAQVAGSEAIEDTLSGFATLVSRLPAIGGTVESGRGDAAEIDNFYTGMADVVATGIRANAAHNAPDAPIASEELAAADLLAVADLQSRTVGLAAAGMAQGVLEPGERRAVAHVVGAYRDQFNRLASRLTAAERGRLQEISSSNEWGTALFAQDELTGNGVLPVPYEDWRSAEQVVRTQLLDVFIDHTNYALDLAEDAADRLFFQSVAAGIVVALISAGAVAISVGLANRLIRRLRRLRTNSLDLAYEKLPSIIDRIHGGETIDVDAETAPVDRGRDEIGQVAEAFAIAQRTAVAAAVAEAGTRDGFKRVFLDIAHRSQVVVRRQLDLLEVAENKQGDPEHLELLFKLDHLATRSRRNSENLLILGGAQPGRKWREPVELEEIVRSAISETEEFTRVSAVRLPRVRILGSVVADLIHLLAELVDNATAFSPPAAPVAVRGNLVGRGAVIEVEDQGLGIRPEERERLNELLRDPPDFAAMTLSGQRHLGLFVVGRLAQRHAFSVNLQESAYGGVKAVVLIPSGLMESAADPAPGYADDSGFARETHTHRAPDPTPAPRTELVPRPLPANNLAITDGMDIAAAPVQPSPPGMGSHWNAAPSTRPASPDTGPATRPGRARGTRRPLPQRQRNANLAPQLRQDLSLARGPEDSAPQARDVGRAPRDAGRARRAMSSFQQGTRRARTTATDSTQWNGRSDNE